MYELAKAGECQILLLHPYGSILLCINSSSCCWCNGVGDIFLTHWVKLLSWTLQWVHCPQITSIVTRSQSITPPLVCGAAGDLHHECAADKSVATLRCHHINMDQNLTKLFGWRRQFWQQKWVQPATSKSYLMNCLGNVSAVIYIYKDPASETWNVAADICFKRCDFCRIWVSPWGSQIQKYFLFLE